MRRLSKRTVSCQDERKRYNVKKEKEKKIISTVSLSIYFFNSLSLRSKSSTALYSCVCINNFSFYRNTMQRFGEMGRGMRPRQLRISYRISYLLPNGIDFIQTKSNFVKYLIIYRTHFTIRFYNTSLQQSVSRFFVTAVK